MQTNSSLIVRFWGVRGSYPTPGKTTVQIGGNTPAVEIQAGSQLLILDAGTGIIGLGRELVQQAVQNGNAIEAALLFSHMHHDHTQGFPFFAPAFIPSTRLYIFGPHMFQQNLDQVLAQNMIPPVFPVTLHDMSAFKEIRSLSETQSLVLPGAGLAPQLLPAGTAPGELPQEAVLISALHSHAHPGGVMIYRIEWHGQSVVYATDTEGYANTDRRLVSFTQGADLLIHDSQYTEDHYLGQGCGLRSTQGWGHSTPKMACDVARSAGVKRLALFHFDPTYSDTLVERIEADARRSFPGAFAAREGLEVDFGSLASAPYAAATQPLPALGYNQPTRPLASQRQST
jgi:phosphoribosyl 1,2-cyclic phosphodiesterase